LNLKNRLLRLFLVVCSLVMMVGYAAKLHDTAFTDQYDFDDTLFTPVYLYQQNGFAASFVINLKYLKVPEPDGYSIEQVDQVAAELDAAMGQDPDVVRPLDVPIEDRPNILVIMDEAFADLSLLAQFETNEDYMPFFRSLSDNTLRGNLHVSIVGGNTATTEFEFLTGSSMAFLPAGSVAYQQYINADLPGLPSSLEKLGYQTVAMHPYLPGGWDRDEVYQFMGFDQILFEKDFTYRQRLRQYVSDRSVFRQLIKSFETKASGTPLFGFAVTMQNHGGYGNEFANFKPSIDIEEPGDNFKPAEHYLSLIKETDRALEMLIDYFASVDEKTVILFFGDHQPNDYIVNPLMALEKNADAAQSEDYQRNRFVVPYLIWANYDIAERQDVTISANFLSALLLETAGVPRTPYAYFLSDMQTQIPVMTATHLMTATGEYGSYDQVDEVQKKMLQKYALLQYNQLFDRQERRVLLFE
jgi:phosphoglycerol transferase MdoB-like AlkP superfamily enzyme